MNPTLPFPRLPAQCSRHQFANPKWQILAQISKIFQILLLQIKNPNISTLYWKGIGKNRPQYSGFTEGSRGNEEQPLTKGDCRPPNNNKGHPRPVQRKRRKRRRGLSPEDPWSLWRLGLMKFEHCIVLFKHPRLGATKTKQTVPTSGDSNRKEENWEENSSLLWTNLEKRRASTHFRLYLSFRSSANFKMHDLVSECWCISCKLTPWRAYLLTSSNFRKVLCPDENLAKEKSDNMNLNGRSGPPPTMADEALKGSEQNKPNEASPSGTKKEMGKQKNQDVMMMMINKQFVVFSKPVEGFIYAFPIYTSDFDPKYEICCLVSSMLQFCSNMRWSDNLGVKNALPCSGWPIMNEYILHPLKNKCMLNCNKDNLLVKNILGSRRMKVLNWKIYYVTRVFLNFSFSPTAYQSMLSLRVCPCNQLQPLVDHKMHIINCYLVDHEFATFEPPNLWIALDITLIGYTMIVYDPYELDKLLNLTWIKTFVILTPSSTNKQIECINDRIAYVTCMTRKFFHYPRELYNPSCLLCMILMQAQPCFEPKTPSREGSQYILPQKQAIRTRGQSQCNKGRVSQNGQLCKSYWKALYYSQKALMNYDFKCIILKIAKHSP